MTSAEEVDEEREGIYGENSGEQNSKPNGFADNLLKIQKAASKLVAIQQLVKASGTITEDEKKTYSDNLDSLGKAAQELSKLNENNEDQDDLRLLIAGK